MLVVLQRTAGDHLPAGSRGPVAEDHPGEMQQLPGVSQRGGPDDDSCK